MTARSGRGSGARAASRTPREEVVDFDLHGRIGLRLIGPTRAELHGLARQLGPLDAGALPGQPDVSVRFVAHLPTPGFLHLEARRSGFTEDGFFLLSRGLRTARARIPFESLGTPCEVVCERGCGPIPFLVELLRLTALAKGLVALHASAFDYLGTGVLVVGWPHGGKTSALLAFTDQGAEFVGDDLVFLDGDGRRMFGLASPIDLADWQLRQLPRARRRVGVARRMLFGSVRRLAPLLGPAFPPLQRRLGARLPAGVVCPGATSRLSAPGKLFLMMTHDSAEIRVEPADPEETIERTIQMARHEGLALYRQYLAYRFAFPGRRNGFMERAHEVEAGLLRRALDGKEAYVVRHPRPVSLRDLHAALRPYCEPRSPAPGPPRLTGSGAGTANRWRMG